jgi:hypothetical protein
MEEVFAEDCSQAQFINKLNCVAIISPHQDIIEACQNHFVV